MIEQNVQRISASRVGTVQTILVEGPSRVQDQRTVGPIGLELGPAIRKRDAQGPIHRAQGLV